LRGKHNIIIVDIETARSKRKLKKSDLHQAGASPKNMKIQDFFKPKESLPERLIVEKKDGE
jgi:hypothetical protein